jgi:hypothetical protein
MTDRAAGAALLLAVLLGGLVRALPFLGGDFPLNDGGLFLVMTQDLQAAGYVVPETTGYNGLEIPFVYSPMAFYLAGILNDVFGVSLLDLFRILPYVFSVAMIPAFFLVARQLLRPSEAGIATVAFALLPRTWEWLIMGGGITRSLGFLLALLAMASAIRMYREPKLRWIVATGMLAALTALAHPQAAVFLALSLLVLLASIGRSWAGLRALVLAGAVGAVIIGPWLAVLLVRHGPEPFTSGTANAGGGVLGIILFLKLRFTGAPFMDVLGIIGFAGFAVALAQRRWMAPAWLVLTLLVDSRGGATFAMLPMAMLVGIALSAGSRAMEVSVSATRPLAAIRGHPGLAAAAIGLVVMAVAMNQGVIAKDDSPVHPVSPDQRAAMEWAGRELPSDSRLAVVTAETWERDQVSEWLPALTEHSSVATFQGFEWLGVERRRARLRAYEALQECGRQTADCLTDWQRDNGITADYVFVPKGALSGPQGPSDCCPALRQTLLETGEVIYDGPGATIALMPDN